MPFLTPNEVGTHLYGEITNEVNRGDATILQSAVDAAVDEASSYFSNYDVPAIFAATGTARNNILLLFLKDMAVWHYIQLANPAIEMELRLKRYERAIEWCKGVQSGKVVPGFPIPQTDPPGNENNFIKSGSSPRRPTYFN